ncbi:MAG: hypothetical protein Q7U36_02015 [bacterium]|nr:hypothetical protein [bacterium]
MNSTKNKIIKRTVLSGFLLFVFCFYNIPKSQAAFWPAVDPGITSGLQKILEMVNGLIVGTLKQQAVKMLNSQVDILAGSGADGEPTFIINWETYLVDEPMNETNLYMNDYISQMTRGRNSSSLYSTEGFSGPANYGAQLGQAAGILGKAKNPELSYEGDPSQMLQTGNFKNMELYLSGVNNPWSFKIAVQAEQQRVFENKKFAAQNKAIANQGFPGTATSPGILTKELMANAQDMPNKILQAASSIPEVTTALVTQMINQSITQGFVSVRSKTAKATAGVTKYTNATNQAMTTYGPAARFGVNAVKQ